MSPPERERPPGLGARRSSSRLAGGVEGKRNPLRSANHDYQPSPPIDRLTSQQNAIGGREGGAQILPFARPEPARLYGAAHQAERQAAVRAWMREALQLLRAGLEGSMPLQEAAFAADLALIPAVREILKADLG